MKKLLLTLACAMTSLFASAQAKTAAVGLNLNYGTEIESLGLGVKGSYCFTDHIRGEASFNYFFPKDHFTMWEINANAHYLFNIGDKFKVYPLVGLTYVHGHWSNKYSVGGGGNFDDVTVKESYNTGKFGVNLGGGAQYDLTDNLMLNFEVKYSLVSDLDQCVISLGAAYKF
ncbi:MAG TPA: porin family protein [Prevotella stercorea]|nr:porin family protein [Leyella stercorea]